MKSVAFWAWGLVAAVPFWVSGCSQQMSATAPSGGNAQPAPSTATAAPKDGFKGVVKLDVRDSTPDWAPYTPKKAPDGAPNFLFVLYDDTGLAAWSPYGGRINMPTLDKLAAAGLTYTQWHTTALCSPTRSTLLTGRNHHVNGMAAITETATGFPGAHGRLPDQAATVAELLQDGGWSTFWIGKNHNVAEQDVASGGSRKLWPLQKGFDRFYGFIGGETNQWYPDLIEDNHFIEAPYTPEQGYHLSKDLADKAIGMIRDQKASNPSRPWFMWFNPGANHAPHHALERPESVGTLLCCESAFRSVKPVRGDAARSRRLRRIDSEVEGVIGICRRSMGRDETALERGVPLRGEARWAAHVG